jgi:hypothetical protein
MADTVYILHKILEYITFPIPLAIVLSVLRFTDFDYPFDIFKLVLAVAYIP